MSLLDSRGFSTASFFRHSLAKSINALAGRGIFCLLLSLQLVLTPSRAFSSEGSVTSTATDCWLFLLLGSMRTCLLQHDDDVDDEDGELGEDSDSFFSVRTPISCSGFFRSAGCNRTRRFPSLDRANNPPAASSDEGLLRLFFNRTGGTVERLKCTEINLILINLF